MSSIETESQEEVDLPPNIVHNVCIIGMARVIVLRVFLVYFLHIM
jgi:hypothetical protein